MKQEDLHGRNDGVIMLSKYGHATPGFGKRCAKFLLGSKFKSTLATRTAGFVSSLDSPVAHPDLGSGMNFSLFSQLHMAQTWLPNARSRLNAALISARCVKA